MLNKGRRWLCVALCAWLPPCLHGQNSRPRSESDPRIKTLTQIAAAAKSKGLSAVFIPSASEPAFAVGLLDAASRYSLVVATPVATEVDLGPDYLVTWCAVRVDRVVIDHATATTGSLSVRSIPPDSKANKILPTQNQILIVISGGIAIIDGITISEHVPGDKAIELGKRYLFILDLSPDRLARLPFEGASLFAIGADGDSLSPMTFISDPVVDDVKSTAFHSVSRIQQVIARRVP